jgi:hypothetical protein
MFYLLSKTHRTRCPTVSLLSCGAFFLGKTFKDLCVLTDSLAEKSMDVT